MPSIHVLDHGSVRLIEAWGKGDAGIAEAGIIEAARMSTSGGFNGWTFEDGTPRDESLLRYLYEHRHTSPFEMAGMTIEVQAPIFVFREWHRHRTQSYNEMSARYIPIPNLHYIPTRERCMERNDKNKQAAGLVARPVEAGEAETWLAELERINADVERHYQVGLALGLPKEIARMGMNVNRYSRMRASANLRNWLLFLTLRMDSAAQLEIREYANAVGTIIAEQFPRTWALFEKQRPA